MIREADEGLHPPGTDPQWSESFYFNFTDRSRSLAGLSRIGLRPNEGFDEGGFLLWLPDGRVAMVQFRGPSGAGELRVADLMYEPLEGMRRWRIVSKSDGMLVEDPRVLMDPSALLQAPKEFAEIELDLTFEATAPPHDIAGSPLADAFGGIGHYDQAGRISGTVRVAGQAWALDAFGTRDHTWGIRDWRAPERWCYLSVATADLVVVASRIEIAGLDLRGGFVLRDGDTRLISELDIETAYEADGIIPVRVSAQITDESGETLAFEGAVLKAVPVSMAEGATLVSESLTQFSVAGREALGIAEHLRRLEPPA